MTENLDKEFKAAIEILDGKMDDSLTFYVPKRVWVASVFFIVIGLFQIAGHIFEFGWLRNLPALEVWDAIFGSAFVMVGVTKFLEARQNVRESHLIRYARHLEKSLAKDY